MATLLDLSNRMKFLAKRIPQAANERKQEVATAILLSLIDDTPVDVSEAVSNWIVGLGQPVFKAVEPYFPGKKGSTAELSRLATQARGIQQIGQSKPGKSIFITNNVEHIVYLNDGTDRLPALAFKEKAILVGSKVAGAPLKL